MQTEKSLVNDIRKKIKTNFISFDLPKLAPPKPIKSFFITASSFRKNSKPNNTQLLHSNQKSLEYLLWKKSLITPRKRLDITEKQEIIGKKGEEKGETVKIEEKINGSAAKNILGPKFSLQHVIDKLKDGNSNEEFRDFFAKDLKYNKFMVQHVGKNEIKLNGGIQMGMRRSTLKITPIMKENLDFELKDCQDESLDNFGLVNSQCKNDLILKSRNLIREKGEKVKGTSSYEAYKNFASYIRGKLAAFKAKYEEKEMRQLEEQYKSIYSEVLSFSESKIIEEESIKDYPNALKIENLIKKLRFFKNFETHSTLEILSNSDIMSFPINHTIFSKGEIATSVYVILKGSINIYKSYKSQKQTEIYTLIESSLYDGDYFGDVTDEEELNKRNLRKERIDRTKKTVSSLKKISSSEIQSIQDDEEEEERVTQYEHTAVTAERCLLMLIPNEIWKNILVSRERQVIDRKIETLYWIPAFQNLRRISLLPLANAAELKTYKLGQQIVNANDELDRFMIIVSGKCGLYIQNEKEPFEYVDIGGYIGGRALLNFEEYLRKANKFKFSISRDYFR